MQLFHCTAVFHRNLHSDTNWLSKNKVLTISGADFFIPPLVSLSPLCPGNYSSCHVCILVSARCCPAFVCCLNTQRRWCSPPLPMAPRRRQPGGNLATSSSPSNFLFCPQSASVTPGDCVRLLHLPPLSPPLWPAVCLSARSSQGSVRCPDAANQPRQEKQPDILKSGILVRHSLESTFWCRLI